MLARIGRARELAHFLFIQRVKGFDPPQEPHFDAETYRFFENALSNASSYLEFGSGGSTVLADRLGVPTVSVEGDPYYAKSVQSVLGLKTKVRIIDPKLGFTKEWSKPMFAAARKAERYITAPYVHVGANFPDLVLVDGRYRVGCTMEAARRAHHARAKTTLLFDDYADRPRYHVVEQHLGIPEIIGRAAVFQLGMRLPVDSAGSVETDPA